MTSKVKLNVYPAGSGRAGFIGQIEWSDEMRHVNSGPSEDRTESSGVMESVTSALGSMMSSVTGSGRAKSGGDGDVKTIVLLDVSGSMGQNVQRVVRGYLPAVLENLGFGPEDKITLVTFSNTSRVSELSINDLRNSRQRTEGATYMAPGIRNIAKIIRESSAQKIRILAISDGALHDQWEAAQASTELASQLKNGGQYMVNSTGVRLMTSTYGQPDTRGLASILQLTTVDNVGGGGSDGGKFLVDIDYDQEPGKIIETMSELMRDNLGSGVKLILGNDILLRMPWETSAHREMYLTEGQNTFWLSEVPTSVSILIEGGESSGGGRIVVEVQQGTGLNFESYQTVLKTKVDYFMKRLKILKVLNTPEAREEVDAIVGYFSQLEKYFAMSDPKARESLDHTLHSRLAFFRDLAKKKQRSVALTMSALANDDRVSAMNSAQQADFLRSATSSSLNARNLAKRATKQGLDFDAIAIREVREMRAHLSELDGIDDSSHYVSFYSQESTLSGIQAVCALADDSSGSGGVDGVLDGMSTFEILQLLNVVGIPCVGPVGDFPDPKTWHLEKLLLGSTVSMADVVMVKNTGSVLREPYSGMEIVNVIPFYDDDRIQQFLMKYAPTLLEYTASLGMRNMILDVPHTYKYTVVGGLWNMVRRLDTEKTEANVDVFVKLVQTYKTAVNGIFDYVVPMIQPQSAADREQNLSFYISNNGVTNMISPIITVMYDYVNDKNVSRAELMPEVLRALYSFEFYQVVRKFHKSADDKLEKRKAMLDSLLGIDFAAYGTPLPPYFEKGDTRVGHHREAHVNSEELKSLIDRVYWVDKIVNMPFMIENSFRGEEGKKAILELDAVDDARIKSVLKLEDSVSVSRFTLRFTNIETLI